MWNVIVRAVVLLSIFSAVFLLNKETHAEAIQLLRDEVAEVKAKNPGKAVAVDGASGILLGGDNNQSPNFYACAFTVSGTTITFGTSQLVGTVTNGYFGSVVRTAANTYVLLMAGLGVGSTAGALWSRGATNSGTTLTLSASNNVDSTNAATVGISFSTYRGQVAFSPASGYAVFINSTYAYQVQYSGTTFVGATVYKPNVLPVPTLSQPSCAFGTDRQFFEADTGDSTQGVYHVVQSMTAPYIRYGRYTKYLVGGYAGQSATLDSSTVLATGTAVVGANAYPAAQILKVTY